AITLLIFAIVVWPAPCNWLPATAIRPFVLMKRDLSYGKKASMYALAGTRCNSVRPLPRRRRNWTVCLMRLVRCCKALPDQRYAFEWTGAVQMCSVPPLLFG